MFVILGDIQHWEIEKIYFPVILDKVVQFLASTDFSKCPEGRIDIDEDRLFAVVQHLTTSPKQLRNAEFHKKYIDVQYLVSGVEIIGVTRYSQEMTIIEDQMVERDYTLVDGGFGEMELVMHPGRFAVFFPNDVHRTGCTHGEGQPITKVVVKIDLTCWK